MARMWFAFSRDGGMLGSGFLGQINPKYRTPVNAILVTSVLAVLITAYSAAYFVVTSISTITLYLAYMFPIYLNWRNKRSNTGEHTSNVNAPWNLKQWGPLVNILAIGWIILISILFILPPNELVLWTMLTVAVLLAVYWFGFERSRFKGPRHMTEAELKQVEKEYAI
jgi:amino acid transporter